VSVPVLDRIVARCRQRIAERQRELPLERLLGGMPTPGERRAFSEALRRPGLNVIAEFKRRSPSRGPIREDLTPIDVAQQYEVAGAAALSILTEPEFFGGSLEDLRQARAATLLPALRKDFLVHEYQVWEARLAGADAVLLIVAALSDAELAALHGVADEAQMDALVEVHDEQELERALACGARLVGVNNRDLKTMEVSLETSLRLAERIPEGVLRVTESGLRSGADLARLRDAGYHAFLIGEHLMQAPGPGLALEELIRDAGGGA
jgi:indole-3-glycerol phosphate synthase